MRLKKLYPPPNPDKLEFWDQFEEVVNVQVLRKNKKDNATIDDPLYEIMPNSSIPVIWKGYDIHKVAKAVHDEFPGIHHIEMITNWLNEKTLVPNNTVIPKVGKIDFLRGPVLISDMVGLAIRLVGECNFALKWEVGRARPEEVAWLVKRGKLDVPASHQHIERLLNNMTDYDDGPHQFTAYYEGSPTHPSWPAMHSAASVVSFWLSIVMDLTEEQLCETRKLDYAIAYGRTVAGVHYPDDNVAGLFVGQEILAHKLPRYLANVYGADKGLVKSAVQNAKYDWTLFKDSACYRGCSSTGCNSFKNKKNCV